MDVMLLAVKLLDMVDHNFNVALLLLLALHWGYGKFVIHEIDRNLLILPTKLLEYSYMWLDLRKPGFHAQLQIFRNTEFNYLKYYNSGREADACMKFATIL